MDGGVGRGLSLYSKAPALNWLRFNAIVFCGIEGSMSVAVSMPEPDLPEPDLIGLCTLSLSIVSQFFQ